MKDQYVGDFSDYLKYALLRAFMQRAGASLIVAWMLTAPDERTDGARTGYLRQPARHRAVDPELFDALNEVMSTGQRSTQAIERAGILHDATTHRIPVPTPEHERRRWYEDLLALCRAGDLVFADPDNGLEVPSVPRGRRNSDKYLQYEELATLLKRGCSVCVYQHFPRVPREPYLDARLTKMTAMTPGLDAFAVYASTVAFLTVGPEQRIARLAKAAADVASLWGPQLSIYRAGQSTRLAS